MDGHRIPNLLNWLPVIPALAVLAILLYRTVQVVSEYGLLTPQFGMGVLVTGVVGAMVARMVTWNIQWERRHRGKEDVEWS